MRSADPKTTQIEAAYETAVRLLARRAHSRGELARKLRRKGYADPIGNAAIDRCEALGYIDDTAACESYCRELIRKGYGPRAIHQRLTARAIHSDLIRSALATHYPEELVFTTATAVAHRKLRQLENRFRSPVELRPRLARFLMQRGFTRDTVQAVMENLLAP